MTERTFDDFRVGETFVTRGVTLTESQIIDFALLYDPQPFHIDKTAAAGTLYGGLIASGFQTLALSFRLFYQAGIINHCSLGSPGFDELRWLKPVRPGDTLHVVAEVLEMTPSRSKPDRGTLIMAYGVVNQAGETVMTLRTIHILCRGASPA